MAKILLLSITLVLIVAVVLAGLMWLYTAMRTYLNKQRLAIQEEKHELLEIQNDIDFAANQLEKSLQREKEGHRVR